MLAAITGADLAILDFIYDNLHCAFLDAVMPVITALGNGGILFIAIAVVMLFFKRTRKTGLMIGCALILGLLVCNLTLKPLVARERPFTARWNCSSPGRRISRSRPGTRSLRLSLRRFSSSVSARRE